jgi:hypothetical protein
MRELSDRHALKAQGEQISGAPKREGPQTSCEPVVSRPSKLTSATDEHRHGANQREVPYLPEVTAAKDAAGGKRAARDDVAAR